MPSGSSRPRSRSPAGPTVATAARGRLLSLPPRPSSATVAASGIGTPSAPRADRQRHVPPHLKGQARGTSPHASRQASGSLVLPTGGSAVSTADYTTRHIADKVQAEKVVGNTQDDSRVTLGTGSTQSAGGLSVRGAAGRGQAADTPMLKVEEAKVVPSLLRRLAGEASSGTGAVPPTPDHEQLQKGKERGQGRRNKRERDEGRDRHKPSPPSVVPAKRRADASSPAVVPPSKAPFAPVSTSGRAGRGPSSTDPDKDPVVGFSIRGAASGASPATREGNRGPGSLLERLQAGDDVGSEWSGRRRKRIKQS
ncbi:hypothetical protein BD309DRAFT_949285 [Dichomitus squalens]|nr:hypothetical protein BD309DRAFT_949285 [Dichomitus squalens]